MLHPNYGTGFLFTGIVGAILVCTVFLLLIRRGAVRIFSACFMGALCLEEYLQHAMRASDPMLEYYWRTAGVVLLMAVASGLGAVVSLVWGASRRMKEGGPRR